MIPWRYFGRQFENPAFYFLYFIQNAGFAMTKKEKTRVLISVLVYVKVTSALFHRK